ncbi:MAG: hypothetical protein V8S89_04285 [Oscillospiraceae bacterium]
MRPTPPTAYGTPPRRSSPSWSRAGRAAGYRGPGCAPGQADPDAVLIFIAAPSFGELEYRLRARGDTAEDAVRLRLQTARREYEQANCYDYIVANDDIDRCVQKL